jgi:hypothetical protein
LIAIEDDASELEFASETLKRDRDIVLKAVSNPEIVLMAVKNNQGSIKFASEKLQKDSEILTEINQ